MEKDINYYLKLPYTIEFISDSEQGWAVRVKELRGCISQGDTVQEAYEMIQDAMRTWLEVAIEDNIPIPEPAPDEDYSGKFVVRLPRSLHRQLAETAEREGVSLNQFVNVALARAVEQVNPSLAFPIVEPSLQVAVKEKKAKYRVGRKKK
jgi:antitoxin HicB